MSVSHGTSEIVEGSVSPESRWHHIVPRFLIRRFSTEPKRRDSLVHWYDVTTGDYGSSTARDSAVLRDYNALTDVDADPLVIEKRLARIEGAAAEVLVRMKKGMPFNSLEQLALARLISAQYGRSPRSRQYQAYLRKTLAGKNLELNVPKAVDGRSAEEVRWWKESGLEDLRKGDEAAVANSGPRAAEVVGQFLVDDALPAMLVRQMKWVALDADGSDFVLADHPVHILDPAAPLGGVGAAWFSSPAVQVTMPIDPACSLLLSQMDSRFADATLPAAGVLMDVNLRQYASAVRLVFSRSRGALEQVVAAAQAYPEVVESYRPRPLRVTLVPSSKNPGTYTAIIDGEPMLVTMERPLRNQLPTPIEQ